MNIAIFFIVISLLYFPPHVAFANNSTDVYIKRAEDLNLSQAPYWHHLLYYRPGWLWGTQGLIREPEFYLAQNGRSDPHAELVETIRHLFLPVAQFADENLHPLCKYPARANWLKKKLKIENFSQPRCKDLDDAMQRLNADAVALVFSGYFVNNPASMFGHTFLRLRRKGHSQNQNELLDKAINFSAQVKGDDPLLSYTWKGVFGGYPGEFGVGPYYFKVQEYNNSESRDLWSFELALAESDVRQMLYSLWEVDSYSTDYQYLEKNCSLVILMLLQNAREDLDLADKVKAWVIPADTVRAVTTEPGLVSKITFRPSALSRFEYRIQDMTPAEVATVFHWLHADSDQDRITLLNNIDDETRRKILDAILERIDFEEGLAGGAQAKKFKPHRAQALVLRSQIAKRSPEIDLYPEKLEPHKGHRPQLFSVGLGQRASSDGRVGFAQLRWRPALHDPLALQQGYVPGYSLSFFDVRLRAYRDAKRPFIESFIPLAIETLNPWNSPGRKLSWQLSTYYLDEAPCQTTTCRNSGVAAKVGLMFHLPLDLQIYGLGGFAGGYLANDELAPYIEPRFEAGLKWYASRTTRFGLLHETGKRIQRHNIEVIHRLQAQLAFSPTEQTELRLSANRRDDHDEILLEASLYK